MGETGIQRTVITTASLFSDPRSYETLKSMATTLFVGGAEMGLIPACVKTPQQALAGMLVLVGMGEDPLTGMQYLQPMPGGKVGLDYKFLMGVVERNAPDWRYEVEEQTDERVSGWFQAPGRPKYHLTYTYEQAKASGVAKNPVWNAYRQDMLFKTWWLRGARRTAPLALRGVPTIAALEDDDSADVFDAQGDAMPGEAAAAPVAEVVDTTDYYKAFIELATKHKFQVKGKGAGERVYRLVVELLKVDGVEPKFKSVAEVSPADWKLAYTKLHDKYESVAEVVEPKQEAGSADNTDAAPEGKSEPAPAEGEAAEPPPSDDVEDGVAALDQQMRERDFLLECSNSLEFAWKEKGSVVRADEKGRWWFMNRDILTRCGFVDESGMCIPKALFDQKTTRYNLSPEHTYALCVQVRNEIAKSANGGRPVAAQRS